MQCRKCAKPIPDESVFCMFCGVRQEPVRHYAKRGNGQGSVYKVKSGKWAAVVTLGYYHDPVTKKLKRKTVSRQFVKKSDAVAALPSLALTATKQDRHALVQLWEDFYQSREYDALSSSQQDKLRYAWNRLAPLHFRDIASLTVADMEDCITGATSTYYPARDMKVTLSHLYRIAVKREIVPLNKSEYIELPEAPKAKRERWTDQEIAALWEDYKDHPFTGYPLILCYTGMRYGELAAMRLSDIHWEERYMIGGNKTDAGIDREIPIGDRILPVLCAMAEGKRTKLLEMNEDNFYAAYWAMIERTGLRHLPPHTCRHYYFSALTAAGVQGGIIAEIGGHANYLTTVKNYVRVPIEDKLRAVNLIK